MNCGNWTQTILSQWAESSCPIPPRLGLAMWLALANRVLISTGDTCRGITGCVWSALPSCACRHLRTAGQLWWEQTQAYFTASSQTQSALQFEAVSPHQACQPTCKVSGWLCCCHPLRLHYEANFVTSSFTVVCAGPPSTVRYITGAQ